MNSTPSGDELVEVASVVYPHDAKFARAELEAEEIPCFLDNERTLDIDWFLATMMGGYRLLVPASFAERASAILDSRVSDAELERQAAVAPPSGEP
jgi:hypothetical protein